MQVHVYLFLDFVWPALTLIGRYLTLIGRYLTLIGRYLALKAINVYYRLLVSINVN